MTKKNWAHLLTLILILAAALPTQRLVAQPIDNNNPYSRPPVTTADLEIVRHAQQILSSPSQWNRADKRVCPADAKTFSLYCALEKATGEVKGKFEHRDAAMQESRFVIDDIAPNRKNYKHRLMDYNNDPSTTFADIQKFFTLLENRITLRLKEESQGSSKQ